MIGCNRTSLQLFDSELTSRQVSHKPCSCLILGIKGRKMSTKSPDIKFSPFEALLIGEKNNVVKRHHIKNKVLVRRINRERKTFNLRDLFDVNEENCGTSKKDIIFKMPQRVRDYLKTKKLKQKQTDRREKKDLVYFNYNMEKMVVKNNVQLKSKHKNAKVKSNKIKFKKKYTIQMNTKSKNSDNQLDRRVVRKFHSHASRLRCNNRMKIKKLQQRLLIRELKGKKRKGITERKRHLLRGKDGKFISKKNIENVSSEETSTNEKCLSDHVPESSKMMKNETSSEDGVENLEEKNLILETKDACDTNTEQSESTVLKVEPSENDEVSIFPRYPESVMTAEDLDEDENLMDVIYENFPAVKFLGSTDVPSDFEDSLRDAGNLLPGEKNVKMYEKKKQSFINTGKLAALFNGTVPYIRPRQEDKIKPYSAYQRRFPFLIDERTNKKNHLIEMNSFENFFLRNLEGKDIFIGNLIKPFWQNSWFGKLPDT